MSIDNFTTNFAAGFTFGLLTSSPYTFTYTNFDPGWYTPTFHSYNYDFIPFTFPEYNDFAFDVQMQGFNEIAEQLSNQASAFNQFNNALFDVFNDLQNSSNNNPFEFNNLFQDPTTDFDMLKYVNKYFSSTVKTDQNKSTASEKKKSSTVNSTNPQTKVKSNSSQIYAPNSNVGKGDARFEKFLSYIVNAEKKVFTHNKYDRGGDTHTGITHTTYDAYRRSKGLPLRSVKLITENEVREIYYNDYYLASGADKIKDKKLALYVFDTAVNMGVKMAKKLYNACNGSISRFEQLRKIEYDRIANLPDQSHNRKGWANRMKRVKYYADNNLNAIA